MTFNKKLYNFTCLTLSLVLILATLSFMFSYKANAQVTPNQTNKPTTEQPTTEQATTEQLNKNLQQNRAMNFNQYNTCVTNNIGKQYVEAFQAILATGAFENGVPKTWSKFFALAKKLPSTVLKSSPVGFAWAMWKAHNDCAGYINEPVLD